MNPATDPLSPVARQILRLNVEHAYERPVVTSADASSASRDLLQPLKPKDLLAVPIVSADDASALLAALWLWHDHLDPSHLISQSLPGPTGSFWHAILHRREGDFSNAKYWYDRCAAHPIFPVILAQFLPIVASLPADKTILRLTLNGWSPHAFVDLTQRVHENPADSHRSLVVSLQQLEWRLLFDHTLRAATGSATAGVQFFTPTP